MNRLSLLVLALPLSVAAAPAPKDRKDEPLYFPTAVGTKWVYEDEDGEYAEAITAAAADGSATTVTVVRTRVGKEDWVKTVRVSPEGVELLASGGVTYEQPLWEVKSRAKSGEEWAYRYRRDRSEFRGQCKCGGVGPVHVPAGKFDAVRVNETTTLVGSGPLPDEAVWYARGVGVVKRVGDGTKTVLKEFVPKK